MVRWIFLIVVQNFQNFHCYKHTKLFRLLNLSGEDWTLTQDIPVTSGLDTDNGGTVIVSLSLPRETLAARTLEDSWSGAGARINRWTHNSNLRVNAHVAQWKRSLTLALYLTQVQSCSSRCDTEEIDDLSRRVTVRRVMAMAVQENGSQIIISVSIPCFKQM